MRRALDRALPGLVWGCESCDSSWKGRQEPAFGYAGVCCLRRTAELAFLSSFAPSHSTALCECFFQMPQWGKHCALVGIINSH